VLSLQFRKSFISGNKISLEDVFNNNYALSSRERPSNLMILPFVNISLLLVAHIWLLQLVSNNSKKSLNTSLS